MKTKLFKLKICAIIFLFFTSPYLSAQLKSQNLSSTHLHNEFICGHEDLVKNTSFSGKFNTISSKVAANTIGKQTVLGDLDFLIIRTNFVGGTVETEFTTADGDIFMSALDSYIQKLSYNKARVKSFELTEVFQSSLTSADIKNNTNRVSEEMRRLAKEAGYKVDDRLVYLVMDAPNLELGPGGAFGIGNGKSGTAWWPSNLNVNTHGAGWSHETFHMFGVGHLGLIETNNTSSYPGSKNVGGLDPYHFMGTEGGLTRWDATKPREALTAQLPVVSKIRLGWVSESNVISIDADSPQVTPQRIRLNISDIKVPSLGNKKIAAIVSTAGGKKFSLAYYRNLKLSADRLDQRGGLLVHEWDEGFFARTFLLDAHPNSVDGSPDRSRQTDAWKSVFEFTDAALRVGETMRVGDLFKVKVEREGGSGNDRWVELSVFSAIATVPNPVVTNPSNNTCNWSKKTGLGTDIGAGSNKVFTVGTNKSIYRWNNGNWIKMPGVSAKRVDVAYGSPYIITQNNDIYRSLRNDSWEKVTGKGLDIGGNSKAVAVIGANNRVYKYKGSGKWEVLLDIKGKRVDIDEKGNPWIVGTDNEIYQFLGSKWDKKGDFKASDISISNNGKYVWAIQQNTGIPFIYKGAGKWEKFKGVITSISVQDNGDLWGTNRNNNIFENTCYNQNTSNKTFSAKKTNVAMYPNPTSGKLFIEMPNSTNSIIKTTIQDINGRVLQENNFTDKTQNTNVERLELNLSKFQKGIYIIRLSIDGKPLISKQVILK